MLKESILPRRFAYGFCVVCRESYLLQYASDMGAICPECRRSIGESRIGPVIGVDI